MKLNQVIAIEKGVKAKAISRIDLIDKAFQKPAQFYGFTKKYQKKNEGDEDVPATQQKVQHNARTMLVEAQSELAGLFDVVYLKETGNLQAVADVRVEGETILSAVPVTYLLFLEKQLTDLGTLVGRMPILANDEEWKEDPQLGLYRTEPTITARTKKVQKPIVLYPATDVHPAQTQLIVEDENVGTWQQIIFSGAIPEPERYALVKKMDQLRNAVKLAREQANLVDVSEVKVGNKILGWLSGAKS